MGHKDVTPTDGKYKIKGKGGKDLDLALKGKAENFIVTEFDSDLTSLREKVSNIPDTVDWFACFAVYNKDNKTGKKSGFANVEYTVTLKKADLVDGKLYAYYNDDTHSLSYETKGNKITFSLDVGDPPIGTGKS